jgi:hypothetical protein
MNGVGLSVSVIAGVVSTFSAVIAIVFSATTAGRRSGVPVQPTTASVIAKVSMTSLIRTVLEEFRIDILPLLYSG